MSDSNDDVGAFLAGFVIGALVGAAAALILAPQSGEQTRAGLADRSRDWRTTGGDRLAQVSSALAEVRARAGDGDGHGEPLPRILLNRAIDRTSDAADDLSTNGDESPEEDAPDST
jgi:gas vesicle protein